MSTINNLIRTLEEEISYLMDAQSKLIIDESNRKSVAQGMEQRITELKACIYDALRKEKKEA